MTGPTEKKPRYRYRSLDRGSKEIRVVELLPGTSDETIRIRFHHVALAPRRQSAVRLPPTRDEIQRTLPADWVVRVCLDGRFIFERVREYGPEEPYETSWLHPVTGVDPNVGFDDNKLGYEGLSYVWAPSGGEEDAHVVLEPPTAPATGAASAGLSIRPNLAAALRQLRYLDTPRRMWIDALCINQADLEERNEQVYIMCDIYRRASHVVVWLGAGGDDSALAVAALRHLGEQAIYTERGAWRTNPPGCSNPELARASVALPYDDRTWAGVARLLRRPWFERLWVWQEVRLADERSFMLCGPDSISLSLFRRAIFCASDKKVLPSAEVRGLVLDAAEVMLPFSNQPFFRELQTLNWKGCADPRDKIYGALGAAPAAIREDVRPDYSLPVEEVYVRFCRAYLARIGRLDFLDRCDIDAREIRGPSWVPDWSVPVDRAVRLPYADVFYAAGASAAEVVLPAAGTGDAIMEAAGVRCGTVSFVGRKAPPDSEGLLAAVRAWEPTALSTERYAPTGERSVDAFVTLLGLGYTIERWPQSNSLLSVPEAAELYGRGFVGGAGGAAAAASHESLNFIRVRHRYFFKTDSGHMGTCHARPRVGDGLVVLLGCPSPLLVRGEEVSGSGSGGGTPRRFRVVGATYTHGLMDTEALLGALPDGWRARMSREAGFFDSMHFFSAETDAVTKEDPRLGDDPAEWERIEAVRTGDDPWNFARYRNRKTREVINSDPRLAAVALEARGVKVDKFCLV
ncbi:HET-domain-containing protein [Colletotrichum zoysiae]|uniref:HET-domain-containing protein n=1 Tax=Colletotrichum zoysiae TaxID=1216348 RepID=A0AAD9H8F9_9PEZI|nr:HET-domain-containing protein [Colletotrichum zoysiae]